MIGERELESRFSHHVPDVAKQVLHSRIRQECHKLAALVDRDCPPGREQSIAMTKIEEAMMWANAAIARSG